MSPVRYLALLALAITVATSPASAQMVNSGNTVGNSGAGNFSKAPISPGGATGPGGVMAPRATQLSVTECEQLGGEIKVNSICKAGLYCRTRDQNQEYHMVCINEMR